MKAPARTFSAAAVAFLLISTGCRRSSEQQPLDRPRLTPKVTMADVSFFSASLNRQMPYRIVLSADYRWRKDKLPVLYLLHGGGGGFRDWSNYSDVAGYAERGLILVMPEGNSSYYVNAGERPQDRYEDYIIKDLIADVQNKFPAAPDRRDRAIAGISMGGYGAIVLSLKHPELFSFAGGVKFRS
jgi:putative tributyrin esterase